MPREFDELESRAPSLNAPYKDSVVPPGISPAAFYDPTGPFGRALGETAIKSVTAPFDIYKKYMGGGYSGNEELAEDLFKEVTLPMAGVGTQFAVKGAAGMFGGKLAPGAPLATLERAKVLEAKGVPREAVLSETGWSRGHDKQWRFEFSDAKAKYISRPPGTEGQLSDFLEHPKLYDKYPSMAKIQTIHDPGIEGMGAYRGGDSPRIRFKEAGDTSPRGDALAALLHEGTHGIQNIEGFNPGTSFSKLEPGMPAWDLYRQNIKGIQDAAQDRVLSYRDYSKVAGYGNKELAPMKDWFEYYQGVTKAHPEDMRIAREKALEEAYARSAGEVEARNVERRRNFYDRDIRERPWWETEALDKELAGRTPITHRQFGGPVGPVGTLADIPNVYIDQIFNQLEEARNREKYGPMRQVSEFIPAGSPWTKEEPVMLEREQILKRLGLERREFGGPVDGPRPVPPGLTLVEPSRPLPPGLTLIEPKPPAPTGPSWWQPGGAVDRWAQPPPPEPSPPPVQPVPGAMGNPQGSPSPEYTMQRPGPQMPIPHPMAPPGGALPPGVIPRPGPEPGPEIVQRRGNLYEAGRGGRMLPPPPLPQAAPPEIRQFLPPQGPPTGFQGNPPVVWRGGRPYTVDAQGNLIPLPAAEMGQ